jgi:hypothetical protein
VLNQTAKMKIGWADVLVITIQMFAFVFRQKFLTQKNSSPEGKVHVPVHAPKNLVFTGNKK